MDRYPIDGYNDTLLGANAYSLLNTKGAAKLGVTSGRTLRLESILITNEHATDNAVVEIFDEAQAAVPAPPDAANQRLTIIVGPENTVMVEFPKPGAFFRTGVSAIKTDGTVNAFGVHVTGFEE